MNNTRKHLEELLNKKQQEVSRINFEIQSIMEVLQMLGKPEQLTREEVLGDH